MKPVICLVDAKTPHIPASCSGYYWLQPVESLNEITDPSRDHAYILPDNSVWVLNYDGTGFAQLNSGGTGVITAVSNTDGYLTVSGSGTNNVIVNINKDEMVQLIKDTFESLNRIVFFTLNEDGNLYVTYNSDIVTFTLEENGDLYAEFDTTKWSFTLDENGNLYYEEVA